MLLNKWSVKAHKRISCEADQVLDDPIMKFCLGEKGLNVKIKRGKFWFYQKLNQTD